MNKTFTIQITEENHNLKISSILERFGFSSATIKSLKDFPDAVLLNNENAKLIDRAAAGDILSVTLSEPPSPIALVEMPLSILYEDDDIIAICKPRNMPTHPSHEHTTDTLANGVMYYFGTDFTFHPITRLDKDTSGVVLVAKHALSAHILTESIKHNQIQKQYLAILNGILSPCEGEICAPVKKADGIRREVSPHGKEAVTIYKTLKVHNGLSLVSLSPVTGRTHQLRVHMAFKGTPIHGDWLYNPAPCDSVLRLHCHIVSFVHPITKKPVTITAPIPEDMNIIN